MTQTSNSTAGAEQASISRADSRQKIRDMIRNVPIAPQGWNMVHVILLLLVVFALPVYLYVKFFQQPYADFLATSVLALTGLLGLIYMAISQPKPYSVLRLSEICREKLQHVPTSEDLEIIIKELDRPAQTGWEKVIDWGLSNLPFPLLLPLIVAALGRGLALLAGVSIDSDEFSTYQPIFLIVGVGLAVLSFIRLTDRHFHDRRLNSLRELLQQTKD